MGTTIQASGQGTLLGVRPGQAEAADASDAGRFSRARVEVRIGHGVSELGFLENHWRALAATSPLSCFFHTFAWQQAYLRHLAGNAEAIHYVSFFANGQAIAIFPLRRIRRSVGRIDLWLWESPTHPHLVLGEPLIAPGWASPGLIRRLIEVLNRRPEWSWDALHLPNLLQDSVVMQLLRATPSLWTHLETTGQSMYFRCGDLAMALANCSSHFRRNLRRQERKLARHGSVTLTLARQGGELDAAFADFLRLEASGWKGVRGRASAIGLHPHLRGFYGALKDGFAATNACLIALLKLDGVAIAAQFCLFVGHTLYVQKIAYDEAWRAEAPGNQLMLRVLEYCCGEPGIGQLSLITAPDWALGRWNPERQSVWEAYVFKASPRGVGGLAMRRFKAGLGEPVRSLWRRARTKPGDDGHPAGAPIPGGPSADAAPAVVSGPSPPQMLALAESERKNSDAGEKHR